MKVDKLVADYVRLRSVKKQIDDEYKAKVGRIKSAMEAIESKIMAEFNECGLESAKTPFGTAYRSITTSATVQDRQAFLDYVRDNEEWSLLDVRANKTAVSEMADECGEVPPGVALTKIAKINIRRS